VIQIIVKGVKGFPGLSGRLTWLIGKLLKPLWFLLRKIIKFGAKFEKK